jgi:hypothetical protein
MTLKLIFGNQIVLVKFINARIQKWRVENGVKYDPVKKIKVKRGEVIFKYFKKFPLLQSDRLWKKFNSSVEPFHFQLSI